MNKIIMPLLLLSAAFVTPAYANYFANPTIGISMNLGSAPNPTPADIRENREPILAVAANPAPTNRALVSSDGHKNNTHKTHKTHVTQKTAKTAASSQTGKGAAARASVTPSR